jgi:FLVCR family feline leukemia virus subgroup C receptor-related protein
MFLRKHSQRWFTLSAYTFALILTQVYWYDFAPVMSFLIHRYRISEMLAGWTVMIFPLSSIVLSAHSGSVLDRRGYRFSVLAGLAGMTGSSVLRVFDNSFWMVLAGQTGISLAVPYIVTGISNVVTDWFDPHEETTITGLCTIALLVGLAIPLLTTPWLVYSVGFHAKMVIGTVLLLLSTGAFWWFGKENTEKATQVPRQKVPWPALFNNRNLIILYLGAFIGQGCTNTLVTWMEILWHERGFPLAAAGMANGLGIAGGIVGCLLLTPFVDRLGNHRLIFFLCLLPGPLLLHLFLWAPTPLQGYGWSILSAFLWSPALALSLTLLERSAGKGHAGAASGMFWTVSNLGVLALSIGFQVLKQATTWRVAINLLVALLALSALIVLFMKESGRQTSRDDLRTPVPHDQPAA